MIGKPIANLLPITAVDAAQYYPLTNDTTEYGYAYTDASIDYLLQTGKRDPSHRCDYITITNADNIYSKQYVDYIYDQISEKKQLISVDMISHHNWGSQVNSDTEYKDGTNVLIATEFQVSRIDLGAATFNMSLFESTGARFIALGKAQLWTADGTLIQTIAQQLQANQTVRIRSVLLMHQ